VTPDGKLRYTAFGNTALYRYSGLRVGEGSQNFKLEDKIIRGRVVDEKNEPVNGAALRIGKELVFTDVEGKFFVRVKKARGYAVKVVIEEFIVPGYFEVVTAPAEIQAVAEDSEVEVVIVVRRVSPPRRPTHTAGTPPAAAPAVQPETPRPTAAGAAARPGETTAGKTTHGYVVQVAAFSQAERAKELSEALRSKGFPAFVSREKGARQLVRVFIGPFRSSEDAETFRSRLAARGYQALIKRQPLNEVGRGSELPEPAAKSTVPVGKWPAAGDDAPEPGAIR